MGNDQRLIEEILKFKYDPLGFVLFVFPWGQKGTPLANVKAPRKWQARELEKIGKQLQVNRSMLEVGLQPNPIYVAISSGRGIGKSAFFAMLDLWMISCWFGGTGIVSANSENQLKSRTMAELGKWHTMAINNHWFVKSSLSLKPAKWFAKLIEEQLKIDTQYYYIEGQTWSEENPDAFAGAHSQIAMMVLFDEASGIPDNIWNVTEGFFTDLAELRLWVVISNPRNPTGKFYDAFTSDRAFWNTVTIDARTVEGTDIGVYQRMVDKYGEDSDIVRVEVKGMFPHSGDDSTLIQEAWVEAAIDAHKLIPELEDGRVFLGYDIADDGNDKCATVIRKGGLVFGIDEWAGRTDELEKSTARAFSTAVKDDATIIYDSIGVGASAGSTLSRLNQTLSPSRRLRYFKFNAGKGVFKPNAFYQAQVRNKEFFADIKAQSWWLLADRFRLTYQVVTAIRSGIEPPAYTSDELISLCSKMEDLEQLKLEITTPRRDFDNNGRVKVESKKDLAKRGVRSPNIADALVMSFAPVSGGMKINENLLR